MTIQAGTDPRYEVEFKFQHTHRDIPEHSRVVLGNIHNIMSIFSDIMNNYR